MEFSDVELIALIRALSVAISEIDREDWRVLLRRIIEEREWRRHQRFREE